MFDVNATVAALRAAVAEAAGVEGLAEAGNGPALADAPTPLVAYRVGPADWRTEGHGYAARDTVLALPVTFYYVTRRDGSGATEALAGVREALDAMAEAAMDGAWRAAAPQVVRVLGREWGTGEGGEYAEALADVAPDWVAGHIAVTVEMVA